MQAGRGINLSDSDFWSEESLPERWIEMLWLVVWNMNFMFPYIGNFIIPTDELIFQRG